jgi:hypothetical protein
MVLYKSTRHYELLHQFPRNHFWLCLVWIKKKFTVNYTEKVVVKQYFFCFILFSLEVFVEDTEGFRINVKRIAIFRFMSVMQLTNSYALFYLLWPEGGNIYTPSSLRNLM